MRHGRKKIIMITESALTVSQLNMYVKMMLESDSRLQKVCVLGEISNFVNHYKTGHCYFSLKDAGGAVKAVMFARSARFLKFAPENGMRVYASGRVSVFERDGVYQLYVDSMEPEGAGALMVAFEQLKNKLAGEGLFADENKKPIPVFPSKIAVVTSPVGAAVQDVINILSRRFPLAEMLLCPVAAQGVNCANENIRALRQLNTRKDIDVIILCRGGGSIEDLWGYNDEQLVRTVAASRIPVITGIGHETDFTLCDFAADMRAPTPSAAAELSVPDIDELYQITDGLLFRLDSATEKYFDEQYAKTENISSHLRLLDPRKVLEKRLGDSRLLKLRLKNAVNSYFSAYDKSLNVLSEKLKLLNPMLLLEKGYIPVYSNDEHIKKAAELMPGQAVSLRFSDGAAFCEVKKIEITENER